ncbi:hypothetical protein EJ05DRAFT_475011 [Pseudovirgaria hyperparasitica]|uniref:Vacuolar protein sorting-associated protein 62 n=1 Tax=Pseudovirgaria hyperparasitica TaxID=470096 RepID=A0A6A6WCT0_9PEZI|nr:uncharacterized protein EJ05DRAFT_475011 [Pseudovirgaria hyperparasitica]KAF2759989.1 hypothetical protein EJ05DRAFT_475011 [Pseudovirgaria hyperparasitica]
MPAVVNHGGQVPFDFQPSLGYPLNPSITSKTNTQESESTIRNSATEQRFIKPAPANSRSTPDSIVVNITAGPEQSPTLDSTHVSASLFSTILKYLTYPNTCESSDTRTASSPKGYSKTISKPSLLSWVGVKASAWLNICGLRLVNSWDRTRYRHAAQSQDTTHQGKDSMSGHSVSDMWSETGMMTREIPDYVFEYAPLVHLYSGEKYWPGDIGDHLIHTTPHLNYTPIQAQSDHPNLTNLNDLNQWGRFVYLQSDDNVEDYPDWLGGQKNIPTEPSHSIGRITKEKYESTEESFANTKETVSGLPLKLFGKRTNGGRSDAPAVLVVVPKPNGVVDAFWFFFYSFNLGNTVFNIRFGNHVGDWEHTLVRFQHGEPTEIFFSEHNFGQAYSFDAVEKSNKRPVGYSATGSHAMYGTAGEHPYVLPNGVLKDVTDRGPLWDPLLNVYAYTYDYWRDVLRASTRTPEAPLEWFYFSGRWGDKIYPLSDPRQYMLLGNYHYVTGPTGPRFKNLARKNVCQNNDRCIIKHWLSVDTEIRELSNFPNGEEVWQDDQPPDQVE